MPKMHLPIPDVEQLVTRPIVNKIVKDIFSWTGLSEKRFDIIFVGESTAPYQPGTAMSEGVDNDKLNRWMADGQIEVECVENYDNDRIMATPVYWPDKKSFFYHPGTESVMFPITSHTEMVLTLRLKMADRTQARRWRDDIRIRLSRDRRERLHEITYSYGIPTVFMDTARMIHKLSEKQAGYGIAEFDDWWKLHTSQKVGLTSDVAGNNPTWVIRELQKRVIGYFDWEVPEETSKDEDPTQWTFSFTYKLWYDKPLAVGFFYPNVVHNQVIPKEYRATDSVYDVYSRPFDGSSISMHLKEFEENWAKLIRPNIAQDRIPSWDEFISNTQLPSTLAVLDTLVTISEADKRHLLDYDDLGVKEINSLILRYIEENQSTVLKPLLDVFNISLYEGAELMHWESIKLEGLSVVANRDLDLRKTYHLRLSVYTDWSVLSREVLERLRHHGRLVLLLLTYMGFTKSNSTPHSVWCNITHPVDVQWYWDYFKQYCTESIPIGKMMELARITAAKHSRHHPYMGGSNMRRITVGGFYILTGRALANLKATGLYSLDAEMDEWLAIHWPFTPPGKVEACELDFLKK